MSLATAQARAGVILQPASASTDMGVFTTTVPNNVRDQSGLSAPYTSLVTDFDTYIASNPTHNSSPAAHVWASAQGKPTGNFDFGLGGTFTLQSFALWDLGGNAAQNLVGFQLLASADASFSTFTSLGSFTANPNNGSVLAARPEFFTFTATSAAFLRMVITSNHGGVGSTGFGEAAFEVQLPTAVPEPGTLALLGAGALSAGLYG